MNKVRWCRYCGRMFAPKSPNQKFCAYRCRYDHRAEVRGYHLKNVKESRRFYTFHRNVIDVC